MKDPICGMTVTDKSFYQVERQGQTHYFCGAKCKARFVAHGLRHAASTADRTHSALYSAAHRRLGWLPSLLIASSWLHSQ